MRKSKEIIKLNFKSNLTENHILGRDALIKRMVSKKPPMIIENSVEQVINPYLVAKFHSEKGVDKEIVLDILGKKLNIKWQDYWSEWCEFWFKSFISIPHNILLDSKTYYKALEKVKI